MHEHDEHPPMSDDCIMYFHESGATNVIYGPNCYHGYLTFNNYSDSYHRLPSAEVWVQIPDLLGPDSWYDRTVPVLVAFS